MSTYLAPAESQTIAARITALEARTGVQVVVAIVGRSDRYPEARWKAFALGVSFASLIVAAVGLARPGWGTDAALGSILAILGAGLANALVANYVRGYERLYVRRERAEAEVRQYAQGLFLERALFATAARTAVLVVVSLSERVVVVHVDRGFDDRIAAGEWEALVAAMTAALRSGDRAGAVLAGLAALESILASNGFAGGGHANALPDRPLEERGA